MQIAGRMQAANEKVQNANDAMDLSKLNRQSDEADKVLYDALSKETDPEKQQKLIADHEQVLPKLGDSYNERVKSVYEKNLNNSITDRKIKWEGHGLQVRAKAAKDKGDFEAAALMSKGDEAGVQKIYELQRATQQIGEQEYKSLTESLRGDMMVANLKRSAVPNPQQTILEAQTLLEKDKSLNPQQQSHLLGIINLAKGIQSDAEAEFTKNLSDQMQKANLSKDFGQADRVKMAEQLHLQVLSNPSLTGTQAETWHEHINRWGAGITLTKSSPDALAAVSSAVNDLRYGRGTEKQVTDLVNKSRPLLSDKDYSTYLARAHSNLNTNQTDFVNKGLSDLRLELGGPDIDREDGFRFEMEDWMDTHKESSEKDRFVAKKSIYTKWRDMRQTDITRAMNTSDIALPLISTKAERDALPVGTKYRRADGTTGIRQ